MANRCSSSLGPQLRDTNGPTHLRLVRNLAGAEQLGWTEHWYGKAAVGALALVARMFVAALYNLGYLEFRGPQVLVVIVGTAVQSLGYLLSRGPIAPVITHVALHVTEVLTAIANVSQLPPHY